MNRTLTKAIEGKTPYEAALGVKPDLTGICEWGKKCWVHIEKGNKLGGHVREGRWVGVDDESKGAQVYWQDTKTITVERNIYFNPTGVSVDHLEGRIGSLLKQQLANPPPVHPPFPRPPKFLPSLWMNPQPKASLRRKNPKQSILENQAMICWIFFPDVL